MHIALLIYGNLETVSGGYLYDRKLVEHLRSQGDQVEIISIPWRSYPLLLADNFSASLFHHLQNLQIDILLQDELNHPSLFLLNQRLRKETKIPLVSIVHHLRSSEQRSAWQNILYKVIEKRYLDSVDALIFNSLATQKAVLECNASLKDKPSLLAFPAGDRFKPAWDLLDTQKRADQPGPLKIVFIGNLIPRKGLDTLLKALKTLPAHLWELNVIGSLEEVDPFYAQKMQKLVSKLDMNERVKFLGTVPDTLIAQTLSNSHLLAVPSSYEGFGIVYLEGMSFGLPAIGAKAGGAQEIIRHGYNGFLVEPGDTESFSAHISNLAVDRQKLLEMSLAARRSFESHPDWEMTGAQIRNFLLTINENRNAEFKPVKTN
ncbi:MAG TPA: glycosyltransferase family 4 protein [Anaerolineales bacterium]|nr:glycosyltransferase family 4 protein [Anaerolineales bacterium]